MWGKVILSFLLVLLIATVSDAQQPLLQLGVNPIVVSKNNITISRKDIEVVSYGFTGIRWEAFVDLVIPRTVRVRYSYMLPILNETNFQYNEEFAFGGTLFKKVSGASGTNSQFSLTTKTSSHHLEVLYVTPWEVGPLVVGENLNMDFTITKDKDIASENINKAVFAIGGIAQTFFPRGMVNIKLAGSREFVFGDAVFQYWPTDHVVFGAGYNYRRYNINESVYVSQGPTVNLGVTF